MYKGYYCQSKIYKNNFANQNAKEFEEIYKFRVGDKLLENANNIEKENKNIVLAAVTQHGWELQFASEELKADKEIVLAAVKQNGGALQFASGELRADQEVVLAAVKQNREALQFSSVGLIVKTFFPPFRFR